MEESIIKNWGELAKDPMHEDALNIILAGIRAADPRKSVLEYLRLESGNLCVGEHCVQAGGGVYVIGFGKASVSMARGVVDALGDVVVMGAVIAPKEVAAEVRGVGRVSVLPGNHPIPGEDTLRSTEAVLEICEEARARAAPVIVLISGGGSALFEKPMSPATLDDIAWATKELMRAGADIVELNTVRKHLSVVKGGRLAQILHPSPVISLIVSDVVGDPIEFIASGPTAPDTTTYADAAEVLRRRGLWEKAPYGVRAVIEAGLKGEIPETPKPDSIVFGSVRNQIVASNYKSLRVMAEEAGRRGYTPLVLTNMMVGEAREIGRFLAGLASSSSRFSLPAQPPLAIILGGETTVTVRGDGVGGRNQELALSFAIHCSEDVTAVLASVGSDGIDGVSEAAGGIVSCSTRQEAAEKGVDLIGALERNDSYTALRRLGRAIITGYTGTNVNDLVVLLVG